MHFNEKRNGPTRVSNPEIQWAEKWPQPSQLPSGRASGPKLAFEGQSL